MKPLVVADESTSGNFVTCGMAWIQADKIEEASDGLRGVKVAAGLPADVEIHCRVLFHHHQRTKSPFRNLDVVAALDLVADCVTKVSDIGVQWFGAWCDASKYPKSLRMIEGDEFRVTSKHIAGMLFTACAYRVEDSIDDNYDLIYDKDSSMVDWGLAARVQATHFARISAHAINNDEYLPFLELADVSAYLLAKVKNAQVQQNPSRLAHFLSIFNSMRMTTVNLTYRPDGGVAPPSP
jgi:hypothetical protein